MRSKLLVAVMVGSFLFAGVSATVAQEKVAKKDVKVEKKVDAKADKKVTPKAAKTTKKVKAEKCTDKEKSSCEKECGAE
jgi:hypothetical protein